MDVFKLRDDLIQAYRAYATSFMRIQDARIRDRVEQALAEGTLWPYPQIGLNPTFRAGGTIDNLVDEGLLHEGARSIFRMGKSPDNVNGSPMMLHQHQVDAIRAARAGNNYVLTTGTGSGKSLSYIVPIVDHVLRTGSGNGVKAIVVYPMNALANSQYEELEKFIAHGPWGDQAPVSYARYTGQESEEARQQLLQNPPDIVLTNYVMLELILTRYRDRRLVTQFSDLRFLVLDELHTYRGRQGADVGLLVRRLKEAATSEQILFVGTSATLSTKGTPADRQAEVAKVAALLFGAHVLPAHVISETLVRATPDRDVQDPNFIGDLRARLDAGIAPPSEFATFVSDPLATWIESTLGLTEEDGRLVRAAPRQIEGTGGAANQLAMLTGIDQQVCDVAIRTQLLAGYDVPNPATGFPVFAFRLHQFLSRGDTVYASPQAPNVRYSTLQRQRFVPGDRDRVLLPLAFCRACGQDYYAVHRVTTDDTAFLIPRDIGDMAGERGQLPGFIYISEDKPWPENADQLLERLPEDWFDESGRIKANYRPHLPQPIAVRPDGGLVLGTDGADGSTTAWWISTPFRFCLSCGVAYAGRLGRDFSRLTTLGSEGRSTATTIMSLAAIRCLRNDPHLSNDAKKLLSFTDNRQDASLQAGHFNDFVQVTLLRAALWRAVDAAGEAGLAHDEVPQRVFATLGLPVAAYSREPELKGLARSDTDRVLREVLAYRLYRDLVRGWRLTQPNLEQCGLLTIEYESLPELAADEEEWVGCHDALATAAPAKRAFLLRVLLDTVRRELAIKVDVLDREHQEGLERRAAQRLAGPWALEDERLQYATEVLLRGRSKGDNREWVYISARGGYGQFLRTQKALGVAGKLTLDATTTIIEQMFERLQKYGLVENIGADRGVHARYQLPAAAIRWRVGDGTRPYQDHIRMPTAPPEVMEPNRFFNELYRTVGEELFGVEAREHTAQVPYEERRDREERFRSADLPVLYCSPTMELGVDISQLNVVNMRNVPPTPANYAQRSGRAGRSGQPALVFTYCAAGSNHDQYFFREPERMVAGQVQAPRLDLVNEDLLRAHVHAVWLSESGLDLGRSMSAVLDLSDDIDDPPLNQTIREHLADDGTRARAKQRAAKVLADLGEQLVQAPWWSDTWLDDTLSAIPGSFDQALGRWRTLYKAALQQAKEQQRIKLSASSSSDDRRQAERLRREAENQLELLRADSDKRGQSDFYTYRYFAAEGFLPGYAFPRLPLSAFIPGRHGRADASEFVQRPRFLAISEFGPQSLIYHEGARYRINRVILPVSDLSADDGRLITTSAKRCSSCGYIHPIPSAPGPDVCARCGAHLPEPLTNLFRLQNVSTVRRDRITSDEEERQRTGYELISGLHFARRHGSLSAQLATLSVDGRPLFELAYGDTATIWRLNLGWRRRKVHEQYGFVLDIERGFWEKADDAEASDGIDDGDPMSKRTQRVIPYVEDTRNALLITPAQPLDPGSMASLQASLKVAMQVVFQLEENELAAEPLPSVDSRQLLLFYESAEGGAGVLRRLLDEPDLWRQVAAEALRRCHIDPATLEDWTDKGVRACEAACYDCLLSYYNQPDHLLLDRTLAKPILVELRRAVLDAQPTMGTAVEQSGATPLEARFLDLLRGGNLRLPDQARITFKEAGTTPDFVYVEGCAVIYVDGSQDEYPERHRRDRGHEGAMSDLGYRVIRFGSPQDWLALIDANRALFGDGRS